MIGRATIPFLLALVLVVPTAMPRASGAATPIAATPAVGPVTTIPVGNEPVHVAVGAGSVWVPTAGGDAVDRIDPATGTVVASIPVGDPSAADSPFAVAATDDAVWVSAVVDGAQAVVRIDPTTNAVAATIPVGVVPYAMAAGESGVWLSSLEDDVVVRIDPATDAVAAEIDVQGPTGLAVADGSVWVALHRHNAVEEIDPKTNEPVRRIFVGSDRPDYVCGLCPEAVVLTGDDLWVSLSAGDNVVRVDTVSGEVAATVPVGPNLKGIAVAAGRVWVVGFDRLLLSAIDPSSNRVVGETPLPGNPYAVATDGGSLWVTLPLSNAVARVPLPA